MYKNLYVVGLAEVSLGIVNTQADLMERLQKLSPTRRQTEPWVARGTGDVDTAVDWLEAHSVPDWSAHKSVLALATQTDATSIVDFGCGTGRLAAEIMDSEICAKYFGFDIDQQRIELARSRHGWACFEHDIGKFVQRVQEEVGCNSCIINFSFVLHDAEDLSSARTLIEALERPKIIIQDLTSSDLPRVLSWLCQASGRVPDTFRERRMSFGRLSQIALALGITPECLEIVRLRITFDDSGDVMNYCDQFGLFAGWDMPIAPFSRPQHLRASFKRVLDTVSFPSIDTRMYVIGVASRAGLHDVNSS